MPDTVTLRLTMPQQWQAFMSVVLGPTVPDELSNRVLVVCTRPRDGVTEVPLERAEAQTLADAVAAAALERPELAALGRLLTKQSAG
ncbi:MAG TPA: hypothetical protein VGL23_23625 [Chloroflexota bacterium]|jgi:hypothetical protein